MKPIKPHTRLYYGVACLSVPIAILVVFLDIFGGHLQSNYPSTLQLSIIYGDRDSTVISVEVSSVVPESLVPKEIQLKVWKDGKVTSVRYAPDSSGVHVGLVKGVPTTAK